MKKPFILIILCAITSLLILFISQNSNNNNQLVRLLELTSEEIKIEVCKDIETVEGDLVSES